MTTEDKKKKDDNIDPTPYKGLYKKELDETDEVKDDKAPDDVDSDPNKGESEPKKEAKPEDTITPKPDDTYKKRYDSLKAHHDRSINDARAELSKLREQLSQVTKEQNLKLPKSPEEIEKWRNEFPDVYDLVVSISRLQADSRAKQIEAQVEELSKREKILAREKALLELKSAHKDFDELVNNSEFHDWVQTQPQQVQDWLYKNPDNSKLAARAIDLYKADKGLNKKEKDTKETKKDAALDVSVTKVVSPDDKEKKVWKLSEIAKLNTKQFEKVEKEIDLARREGRIVDG